MADSVDVLESQRNKADLEETIQTWLDANSGADFVEAEIVLRGRNKILVAIFYNAAA